MEINANLIAVALLFGVVIAVLTEVLKHFDKQAKLTEQQIQLFTLVLGMALGLGTMYFITLDFWVYIALGVASAWVSTGVYEHAIKWATKGIGIKGE